MRWSVSIRIPKSQQPYVSVDSLHISLLPAVVSRRGVVASLQIEAKYFDDQAKKIEDVIAKYTTDYPEVDFAQRLRDMAAGDPSAAVRLNARYYAALSRERHKR